MNISTLDFTSRLNPEETEYTRASLEHIKESILRCLDIVEVARKLGIKLHKLPMNTEEWENESSTPVFKGSCPCTKQRKSNLRIFPEHQSFGCLKCGGGNWGDISESHGNIFALLHLSDSHYAYDYNDETDQKQIEQLFELFPEKLAFLQWHDLNRYEYVWDYFSLSEEYYDGIKEQYNMLCNLYKTIRIINEEQAWVTLEILNKIWRERDTLFNIIQSYEIVSQIYSRREEINKIVHAQSPQDIGFESELSDQLLEEREWYS